jgi:hypothetical protein
MRLPSMKDPQNVGRIPRRQKQIRLVLKDLRIDFVREWLKQNSRIGARIDAPK